MPQTDNRVRVVKPKTVDKKVVRQALTPEANENQMISLAMDVAKEQLLNGTASSQLITHFLTLGSSKKKLEAENLELQNELLKAKTAALKNAESSEKLYAAAIKAMGIYSGTNPQGDDTNDEY